MAEDRVCPVCRQGQGVLFARERQKPDKYSRMTYASRKIPEFMCLRLLRCLNCDSVYAAAPPDDVFLARAYGEADYDSQIEATCAAATYRQALAPELEGIGRHCALDVGAGDGAMLAELLKLGFQQVAGIEPSPAAVAAAPPKIRPLLRPGLFSADLVEDLRPDLITSFMTLEHLKEPGDFADTAFELLQPGGLLAVVVHNWRGALNRILGPKSPIIDVEHLQLFSPRSIRALMEKSGFRSIAVKHLRNSYPLAYWMRLAPIPRSAKQYLLDKMPRESLIISLNVGNIMAIGKKN